MLDPEDGLALKLAEAGNCNPAKIVETANRFAIEWTASYRLDGEAFVTIGWVRPEGHPWLSSAGSGAGPAPHQTLSLNRGTGLATAIVAGLGCVGVRRLHD